MSRMGTSYNHLGGIGSLGSAAPIDGTVTWIGSRFNDPTPAQVIGRIDPSVFLHVVPLPSGEMKSTIALDYDQRRICSGAPENFEMVVGTYVKSVSRLCDVFTRNLQELPSASSKVFWKLLGQRANSPDSDAIESLTQWVPLLRRGCEHAPVRFVFPKADVPREVLEFTAANNLLRYFRVALLLAPQFFKIVERVEARLQYDPDEDVQRVIVDLVVDGEIDEVLASKEAFDQRWGEIAPLEIQDIIRVLYDFV